MEYGVQGANKCSRVFEIWLHVMTCMRGGAGWSERRQSTHGMATGC